MKLYTPQECGQIINKFFEAFGETKGGEKDFMEMFSIVQETTAKMDEYLKMRDMGKQKFFIKFYGEDGGER